MTFEKFVDEFTELLTEKELKALARVWEKTGMSDLRSPKSQDYSIKVRSYMVQGYYRRQAKLRKSKRALKLVKLNVAS